MAEADRLRLQNRTQNQYDGYGYAALFTGDLNAVAAVGNDVAADALAAQQAADAAAANVLAQTATNAATATAGANTATTQAGIATTQANAAIAAAQNIPTPGTDPTETPRNADLGSAAFVAANALRGRFPAAAGAAYQITADDWGRTLIAESGTLTWTLPLITQLPDGWWVQVWNRSGNTLTINRAASAVIGASAASVTVADGAGLTLARRDDTRFERIA
ncbi:MAG TPA: hypothetical protein VGN96_15820 [Roseococcus sp.]|jgi:hypothetical protein|nr:hypothetical protein [Roseococcus sp.]